MKRGVVCSIDEGVAYKKKKECMHGAYGRKNGKMVKQQISEAIVNMNTILMEERKGEEVSTLSFPRDTKNGNCNIFKASTPNWKKNTKSIERKFLKVWPEERKRFSLTTSNIHEETNPDMETAWPAICLDLYAINYLKEKYFETHRRLNNICNYTVPLAFVESSDATIARWYNRIYKQLPLRFCLRLSIFRWIASMICSKLRLDDSNLSDSKAANAGLKNNSNGSGDYLSKDEVINNVYVQYAIKIKGFLDELFANIPDKKDNADANIDVSALMATLDASHHVKTRFLLTEHGKTLLLNTNDSFQPCVPHSIISYIKCSLTTKNLYCPQKNTYIGNSLDVNTKNMIYAHEAKNINNDISLGTFPYSLSLLKVARHFIVVHLAGWPEGAAMFALHQMFGTTTSVFLQNAIDKIFGFVNKISAAGENDGNSVDNANNGSVIESDYSCENGGDAEVYRDEKVESSVEMEDDLYEWMNSVFDESGSEDDIRNSFESFDGSQKGVINPTVFDKEKIEATVSTSRDIGNGKTKLVSKSATKKSLNVDNETSSKHSKVNSTFDITDVSSNEGNNMQKNNHTVREKCCQYRIPNYTEWPKEKLEKQYQYYNGRGLGLWVSSFFTCAGVTAALWGWMGLDSLIFGLLSGCVLFIMGYRARYTASLLKKAIDDYHSRNETVSKV
eukprot:g222.t1